MASDHLHSLGDRTLVVGGGLVDLVTAYRLLQADVEDFTVREKDTRVACQQSTH